MGADIVNLQVIHGERIVVLSPNGYPDHSYNSDFNLDLRKARNARTNFQLRWKKIFEDFKAEHEASKARGAEKLSALQRQVRMTGHQRRTMLARQDEIEYQERKEREDTVKLNQILQSNKDAATTIPTESVPKHNPFQTESASEDARGRVESGSEGPGELAVILGTLASEQLERHLVRMWLWSDVFGDFDSVGEAIGLMEYFLELDLQTPVEEEMAAPVSTPNWVEDELYRKSELVAEVRKELLPKPAPEAESAPVRHQILTPYKLAAQLEPNDGTLPPEAHNPRLAAKTQNKPRSSEQRKRVRLGAHKL